MMKEKIKTKRNKIPKIEPKENQEILNQIKGEIKKEILNWIKKWGKIVLSIFTVLAIIGFSVSLFSIYNIVVDNSSKFIAERINEQFSKPYVESTLKNVAEKEATTIITEHVQPEIEKVKEEVNSFELFLNDYQKKYDTELTKITKEVSSFSKRNEIIQFGDRAITYGDRDAFNKLVELVDSEKNDFKEAAFAEFYRVKKFYVLLNRFADTNISYKDTEGNIIKNEQIPTNILIDHLLNNNEWKIRVRAAFCLKTKKEKEAIDALVDSIKNDQNLDVVKESISSFEILTGYDNPDIIDGRHAIQWWEKNKSEFQLSSN